MTQEYYGTKKITAWPQEKDGQSGYGVKYADGYVSWSPKAVFEEAYQPLDALSFGHALAALKTGARVARAGWNGKGMWLRLVGAQNYEVDAVRSESHSVLPFIGMKTADNYFVPWLASQTDVIADDWQVLEDSQ